MKMLRESNYYKLEEDTEAGAGTCMMLHFMSLMGDAPTSNGRLYPSPILKKAVNEFNQRLAKHSAFGADQHPGAAGMEVKNVSHQITKMEWDPAKKAVMCTIKVLPTDAGRNLQTIIRHGGSLGVSMAGRGSEADGVVGSDYEITSCDFCLNPSVEGAWVNQSNMFESAAVLPEALNEALDEKFHAACVVGGFIGTKDEYRRAMVGKAKPVELTEAEQKEFGKLYAQALTAGFRQGEDAYKKIFIARTRPVMEAIAEAESEGVTDEELEILLDALEEAVNQRYGGYEIVDWDPTHVIVFNPETSECSRIDYLVNDAGCIELVGEAKKLDLSEE